jgi:hypothetical protein
MTASILRFESGAHTGGLPKSGTGKETIGGISG